MPVSGGRAKSLDTIVEAADTSVRATCRILLTALMAAGIWTAHAAAGLPQANIAQWIESLGGEVVRDPGGAIVEVSLARTWATDNDIERVAEIAGLKRLDL